MDQMLPKLSISYIRNNIASVAFLASLIVVNLIIFITRVIQYSDFGLYIMLARANGQCLNFNCSIILFCVCKRSITYLRSVGFSEYLPLDHHIYYHKLIGWAICFFSVFHTLMHLINFNILSHITTITWYDFLFTTYLDIGWIGGAASISGWILLGILALMIITAQPFMRRSGMFEVFYYTHLLYIIFYICLFIHAPRFWLWFLGPFCIFCVECLLRIIRSFEENKGLTYIEQGVILPSKVIQLIIRRPCNFEFHPGDYTYIQIPEITKYEWHPLTISSAPEQSEVIWVHIRAVGEWTNRLYNFFLEEERKVAGSRYDIPKMFKKSRIQNEPLSFHQQARIMVLPIPEDCDPDDGCGNKPANNLHVNDFEMEPMKTRVNSLSLPVSPIKIRSPFAKEVPVKNVIQLETPLKVRLDGPYGSPSSHIFHTQHAILIATGIGVTPFASILQSIMHRYIEAKRSCPNCQHTWSDPIPPNVMKLRKVDFMWINRDQKSFEWFVNLLNDLETQQIELGDEAYRFLNIYMHLTQPKDASNNNDFNSPLKLFPNQVNSNGFICKISNGRPNWNKFFQEMDRQKRGRITVFFCGQNKLAKHLRNMCTNYGFQFRKEVF